MAPRLFLAIACFCDSVLLEHSCAYLFAYCLGCFHTTAADLNGCDRDCMARASKIFTAWSFTEKVLTLAIEV